MPFLESYKHKYAIQVLKDWIEKDPYLVGFHYPVNCITEMPFYVNGMIIFVPDLTVLIEDMVHSVYEVWHTNGITGEKLLRIQYHKYRHKLYYDVYEIEAEWIMRQVDIPYKLNLIKF